MFIWAENICFFKFVHMIWEFESNLSAVSRSVSPSHAAGRRKCNSGTTWKQTYGRQHREGQTILQSVQDVVPWKMHRRRNLAKLDQNTVQSQKRNRHESAKRHTTEAENSSTEARAHPFPGPSFRLWHSHQSRLVEANRHVSAILKRIVCLP